MTARPKRVHFGIFRNGAGKPHSGQTRGARGMVAVLRGGAGQCVHPRACASVGPHWRRFQFKGAVEPPFTQKTLWGANHCDVTSAGVWDPVRSLHPRCAGMPSTRRGRLPTPIMQGWSLYSHTRAGELTSGDRKRSGVQSTVTKC